MYCPVPRHVLKDFAQGKDLRTNLRSAQSILLTLPVAICIHKKPSHVPCAREF